MFAPLLDHTAVDSLIYYPLNNQLINLKDHTTADNQSIRQDHTAVYNWIHYPLDNQSIKTSIHQSPFHFHTAACSWTPNQSIKSSRSYGCCLQLDILSPRQSIINQSINENNHITADSRIYFPLDNQSINQIIN